MKPKRPLTSECAVCKSWAGCDWFDMVEAIEDAAEEQLGAEVGWAFISACIEFKCQDFEREED